MTKFSYNVIISETKKAGIKPAFLKLKRLALGETFFGRFDDRSRYLIGVSI